MFPAWAGPNVQLRALVANPPVRLLLSYAYDESGKATNSITQLTRPNAVDLMADSGAFTAWTQGKHIDLDSYVAWARATYRRFVDPVIINLDVIPGVPGAPATQRERQRAISQGMDNADALRSAGLPVMEVFHMFDGSFKVMEALWERRQPGELLGIGGIAGKNSTKGYVQDFARGVFARVKSWCGGWDGIVRLHGLGVSPDNALAHKFPWWSIDSSSWNSFDRYGNEVSARGASVKRGTNRGLTSNRPIAALYYERVVQRWRRLESDHTRLWEARGVSFEHELRQARDAEPVP